MPTGPKTPETVRRYSTEIGFYLIEQGVKAIVVACNTATAHALPQLRDELPVPVIGVIDPGARAAVGAVRRPRPRPSARLRWWVGPSGAGRGGAIACGGWGIAASSVSSNVRNSRR